MYIVGSVNPTILFVRAQSIIFYMGADPKPAAKVAHLKSQRGQVFVVDHKFTATDFPYTLLPSSAVCLLIKAVDSNLATKVELGGRFYHG